MKNYRFPIWKAIVFSMAIREGVSATDAGAEQHYVC
jgi:hypothetical protein